MTVEIVSATEALVAEIEAWLDEEEAAYDKRYAQSEASGFDGDLGIRGFRCNWNSTKSRWRNCLANLDVLLKDDPPVSA